jgi:hypothetical protein
MDLNIKYKNGSMIVHLEELLSTRNISKIRKLVKVIQNSDTPNEIKNVQTYIEQFNNNYDASQMLTKKEITGYSQKVAFSQQQLEVCLNNRGKYPKKSDGYNYYNSNVKINREGLRCMKMWLRSKQQEFSSRQREQRFLERVSEIIS